MMHSPKVNITEYITEMLDEPVRFNSTVLDPALKLSKACILNEIRQVFKKYVNFLYKSIFFRT